MANTVKMSLGKKATILILVFAFVLAFATILVGYTTYSRSMDQHYEMLGRNMIRSAVNMLEGDFIDYYIETGKTDAHYENTTNKLDSLVVDDRIPYLFIFKPTEEGQLYIYDSDPSEEHFELGYLDPWYSEFEPYIQAFLAGEDIPPLISNGEFGWIMTVYEQLYNSDGNVVAYVGVDISMDSLVEDKARYLLVLILTTVIITAVFSVLYVFFIRRVIVDPINRMARAADEYLIDNHIESSGKKSSLAGLKIVSRDELGSLAESLQSMESKIREYIYHLDVATQKAETDSMTGLYNREAFRRHINGVLDDEVTPGKIHAFLMMDLDDYKQVNDTYGHVVGDEVLIACAREMRKIVRTSDIVSRMGGDEFAIFLNSVGSVELAKAKTEALLEAISGIKIEGSDVKVSASIGISFYPNDAEDSNALYEKADSALYVAKTAKKGGYMMAGDLEQ